MEKVIQVTSRLHSTTTISTGETTEIEERDFVNRIFSELCAIFTKWREVWVDNDSIRAAKRQWLQTLKEQGISSDTVVKCGLKRCRASGYVRPVPAGQFCQWAIEEFLKQNNVPDRKTLFRIVLNRICMPGDKARNYIPSPPELWIFRHSRWPQLKTESTDRVQSVFDEIYDELMSFIMSGNELPKYQVPGGGYLEQSNVNHKIKAHCEKNYSRDQVLEKIRKSGCDIFTLMLSGKLVSEENLEISDI